MKALVFGASGLVGHEVIKGLQQQGIALHAVRHRKAAGSSAELKWFEHDLAQGTGPEALWSGVTHVFLMSPPGYTEQDKILIPVIEKAQRSGIQKLVLMTAMGVNHAIGSPMQKVETALQNSGLIYAIIRPNWFMQNFHSYWGEGVRQHRQILVPGGQARVSFIDARDIGAVAARLLVTPGKGEYDLTGPESLTHAEAAQILSEALGTTISYTDADPKEFKALLLKVGLPEDYASFMLVIFAALREGYAAPVTPHVEEILGRKAFTLMDYATSYREALTP
jgi:uncharacterized protein YbjT (DUF2867 family)